MLCEENFKVTNGHAVGQKGCFSRHAPKIRKKHCAITLNALFQDVFIFLSVLQSIFTPLGKMLQQSCSTVRQSKLNNDRIETKKWTRIAFVMLVKITESDVAS